MRKRIINMVSNIDTDEIKQFWKSINTVHSVSFSGVLPFAIRSSLNVPGFYRVRNIKNDTFYLGSASNLMTRFSYHKNHLNIGQHDNLLLQDDYNMFGESNFTFEVLKLAENLEEYNKILQIESKLILYFRKINTHIYNIYVKPFREIKNNRIAKLLNKTISAERFSKKWVIETPNGERLEISNLRDFCRKNSLGHQGMMNVADNKITSYKNFKCSRGEGNIRNSKLKREHLRGAGSKNSKKFLIRHPDGKETEIIGLQQFCRDFNLKYPSMIKSLKKDNYSHLGYKVLKELK